MRTQKLVSVVIPALNEEGNLHAVYSRVAEIFSEVPFDFELVFVDDGSTDRTLEVGKQLHAADPR
ncbi:MAG: glycosyltransferase, partial [Planctomycetaceae bacterium]